MEEETSKRKEFLKGLDRISLDPSIGDDLANAFDDSSFPGTPTKDGTPVNLSSPFPDFSDSESDQSKPEESENSFKQPPVSPIVSISGWTSSGDFETEIKRTMLEMAEDSVINPQFNISIINSWFDLTKSPAFEPGRLLADDLLQLPEEKLTPLAISQTFSQLDDIRTTTGTNETAILFFKSSLSLFHKLSANKLLHQPSLEMVNKAIETMARILGKPMLALYKESLELRHSDPKLMEIIKNLCAIKSLFTSEIDMFIYKCAVDYVDCELANNSITMHLAATLSQAVQANTNLSTIEADNQTKLPRFQQSLLVVIASSSILDGKDSFKSLVPLISPNLIYMILCNVKPDEMQPERIEYKLIDRFMTQNKCDLSLRTDDILLVPSSYSANELLQIKF